MDVITTWYDDRHEAARHLHGRIVRLEAIDSPGGRDAEFALVMHEGESLPLYAPTLLGELATCGDRSVQVTGKVVDLSHEGFGRELWIVDPPSPNDEQP